MTQENSWYATDRKDNAIATASKVAEPFSNNVITAIHAAFSGTKNGTLDIKEGTTTKITLDVVNSLDLDNLNLEFAEGKAISAVLSASGTSGTYGSILLNGYVK